MATDKNAKTGNYVYGLDIGTRSIVGTVGYRQKDRFIVVAQQSIEHESRAMIDGQIHDINTVSETIREVTDILEERIKQPLKQVCIAAAGRVLKTVTVHVDMDLEGEKTISKEDIFALDSLGIEKAYETFSKSDDFDENMKFYCVGYSIMHYFMNGYPMNQLENHKAKEISADLIATFLPDDVVDGLYKSVELAGLEVANLTLEPIAAIELAIPEMYRMLNIALIDVGAGTSDISITKDGSIIAYGMLPIAGDCLTEDIARHCLVDFQTAETIKRGITDQDIVEYKDIMGIPQKISKEEVLSVISDNLENMSRLAAEKIKELNGNKPVSAVFVVGGGGKIETYTERVAQHLGIAPERCAVRGEEVMTKVDFMEKNVVKDSLLVTPIGICLNYYEQSNNFIFVNFNEKRIKLYDNNHLAIVDAAILAEFPNEDLFPKRGESLDFTLNGQAMSLRGKRGESATVWLNGEEADIHASIRSNDIIRVVPSTSGEKASMVVSKLPGYNGNLTIKFEDSEMILPKLASVNGKLQSAYYQIQDGDVVELMDYYTVLQIAEFMDVSAESIKNVWVNHEKAGLDTKVYHNFSVSFEMTDGSDAENEMDSSDEITDNVAETSTINTSSEIADISSESVNTSSEKNAKYMMTNTDEATIDKITGNKITENKTIVNKTTVDKTANDKTTANHTVKSATTQAVDNSNETSALSALEKAKQNAQKTIEKLQFEHAEESLMAMIQSAMNPESAKTSDTASDKISVKAAPLKIDKSAKELYSSIQSNISRIKSGEDIVQIRKEAIEVPPILPPPTVEVVNGKTTQTIHVLVNGKPVTLKGKADYIYVDVFEFYEFDLSKPQGKAVVTMINGRDAQYVEPLSNGDELQIYWRD
ncbi:MAG: rod shape-determining protein [Lachnospiraceae bacterium]|nr:rod shape-determining protein [Lachnospiraceae bacterium]